MKLLIICFILIPLVHSRNYDRLHKLAGILREQHDAKKHKIAIEPNVNENAAANDIRIRTLSVKDYVQKRLRSEPKIGNSMTSSSIVADERSAETKHIPTHQKIHWERVLSREERVKTSDRRALERSEFIRLLREKREEESRSVLANMEIINQRLGLGIDDRRFGKEAKRVRRVAYHDWAWPKSIDGYVYIPFNVFSSTKEETITAFMQAVEMFNDKTCIRFVEKIATDIHYVNITSKSGCSAHIGRQKEGDEQWINLQANGCSTRGYAIHEAMHTLGFDHTMARADRDEHIEIDFDNIMPVYKDNFEKHKHGEASVYGQKFDLESIMMYSWNDFARVTSKHTIIDLTNRNRKFVSSRELRAGDLEQINRMYRCDTKIIFDVEDEDK